MRIRNLWVSVVAIVILLAGCQQRESVLPVVPQAVGRTGLVQTQVVVNATGAAGAATGTGTSELPVSGKVLGVYLDYGAGISSTTDVTVAVLSPDYTVLLKEDSATDALYQPRLQVHDGVDGSAMTYDGTYKRAEPVPVAGILQVTVGETTAMTPCVTAYVLHE